MVGFGDGGDGEKIYSFTKRNFYIS